MEDFFNYRRRKSSIVNIGNTPLGGDNPIRIQSMANVSTMDTDAAVCQAIRMIEAGAEYVRFTAQGEREARNLGVIRKQLSEAGYTTPLVATRGRCCCRRGGKSTYQPRKLCGQGKDVRSAGIHRRGICRRITEDTRPLHTIP